MKLRTKRRRPTTNRKGKPATSPLRIDPSRTSGLRKRFAAALAQRFARLRLAVVDLIDREDALGLRADARAGMVGNTRWRFRTSADKVREFQAWLRSQIQGTIHSHSARELWQRYVEEGLRKGAGRAFDDTRKSERARAAAEDRMGFYAGTRDEFLRSAFNQPVAVEKVMLLAGRVFTDLEGVTDQMATQMSRTLTDGLVQGKGLRDIGRDLAAVTDMSRGRAETIARTEIIRAHAEGQLLAFEELGVEEVGAALEWSVTKKPDGSPDNRVCPLCRPLDGVVLKVAEAHGMIPRHPS